MKKITSLFLIAIFNLIAIFSLTTLAQAPYPLDIEPGAVAAYSVRQLSSTYTGSLFLLRRDSDNTTQNINFTATGLPDTEQIEQFLGTANGFIQTWYDQSGNANHLSNASNASQPQLTIENGLYTIHFDGNNDILNLTAVPLNDFQGFLFVSVHGTTANESIIMGGQNQRYRMAIDQNGSALLGMLNPTSAIVTTDTLTLFEPTVVDFNRLGITATGKIYINNLFEVEGPLPPNTFQYQSLGQSFNGDIYDFILYNQSLSDRADITENIIDFWALSSSLTESIINPATGNIISIFRQITSGDIIQIIMLAILILLKLFEIIRDTWTK